MIWGGWYWGPLPNAKIAVDVFMAVSGFLMVHQTYLRSAKETPGSLKMAGRFYVRRFFRIAPLYYLVLVFLIFFGEFHKAGYGAIQQATRPEFWEGFPAFLPKNVHYTAGNLLMHFSFLFGISPRYSSSMMLPDWSIGLEMQFYAVFPLLIWLLQRCGAIAGSLLLWMAAIAAEYFMSRVAASFSFVEPSFLALKGSIFLSGMIAATASWQFRERPRNGSVLMILALLSTLSQSWIITAVILIMLLCSGPQDSDVLLAGVRRAVNGLLGNRVMRFMADTSYGVYLVHGFFISMAGGWMYRQKWLLDLTPPQRVLWLTLVVFMGAYFSAWVLHYLVEKPGIALGRRLLSRSPRRSRANATRDQAVSIPLETPQGSDAA
jgi:peptidoglycan/LPS O-acetylase OafA/YrhL